MPEVHKPQNVPVLKSSADCPDVRKHTTAPDGYLAWHEWAEKKSRRHYQVRCSICGFYAIWKRKP